MVEPESNNNAIKLQVAGAKRPGYRRGTVRRTEAIPAREWGGSEAAPPAAGWQSPASAGSEAANSGSMLKHELRRDPR